MDTACQQRFAGNHQPPANQFQATMTDTVFQRLSVFIKAQCGIELPPSKKIMLEGRIRKRLHNLGMNSFENYCHYLFSPEGVESELSHMLDVVTTNKTDFFREPGHFEYLTKSALPDLIKLYGTPAKCFRVWSAACSTGEEPFTLAMTLSEFAQTHPGFQYDILATDISNQVLERAREGIYEHDKIEPIPLELRKKYLLKSKDHNKKIIKFVDEVRNHITFKRLNLMDSSFHINELMDAIFCRNVMIYFDRENQEKLINRFYRQLIPGGYLFMGHSETLTGMKTTFSYVAATVYKKPQKDNA